MASKKEYRLSVLDFLVAALNEHNRELTALGESLQESIRLLNQERLVEKYDSIADRRSGPDILLNKIDDVYRELQALGKKTQKLGSNSLELVATRKLSHTHLKTYRALSEETGMTASEIAGLTRRSRGLETIYLNQFVDLGFVEKVKKGRKYYYARVPIRQTAYPASSSIQGRVMIVVMVSEQMSEDQKDIEDLVSRRLSDLKNWKIEKSTILSR